MGFKENLLKKMAIDRLASRVIRSGTRADSEGKFDKASMQQLLEMGAYAHHRQREMDLYILENGSAKKKILVLDNGLAIYLTTIEDVLLRKSPTVKEMISIRNAIKILNDKDVVLSKKADSVRTVQADIVDGLDLAYTSEDLEQIEKEGRASLENHYGDGVLEALQLFAELLQYEAAPKPYRVSHHKILGSLQTDSTGKVLFGPIVIHDLMQNRLQLIEGQFSSTDKENMDRYRQVIEGHADADITGQGVFTFLKAAVPVNQP